MDVTDIFIDRKNLLLNEILQDGTNLFDKFIHSFIPYAFDALINNEESGKKFWTKEVIFSDTNVNNNILIEGKIYGYYLNITESFCKIDSQNVEDITFLSTNSFMYKNLLTSCKSGQVFIPLIPIMNENGIKVINSFKYPNYFESVIQDFPNIKDVNDHAKIVILDVYNFILGRFAGMNNLPVISYFKNGKIVHCTNIVTYGVPVDDSTKEVAKIHTYEWIQVKGPGGINICPIPLMVLVPYYHAMHITCGIPIHMETFFKRQLKCDKFGVIAKNGCYFFDGKVNNRHDYQQKITQGYLVCSCSNDPVIEKYRKEVEERMLSLQSVCSSNEKSESMECFKTSESSEQIPTQIAVTSNVSDLIVDETNISLFDRRTANNEQIPATNREIVSRSRIDYIPRIDAKKKAEYDRIKLMIENQCYNYANDSERYIQAMLDEYKKTDPSKDYHSVKHSITVTYNPKNNKGKFTTAEDKYIEDNHERFGINVQGLADELNSFTNDPDGKFRARSIVAGRINYLGDLHTQKKKKS